MQAGLVVLIADDDRDMRGYVKRCVERHGLAIDAIIEVRNGQEALDVACARRVDLLISDGVMPRLDGFALCAALRQQFGTLGPAVLLITGEYDAHETARRAAAAGADGILLKPFNALTLCQRIDDVLQTRRRSTDGARKDLRT